MRIGRGAGSSRRDPPFRCASTRLSAAASTRSTRSDRIANRTDADPPSATHTGNGDEERAMWPARMDSRPCKPSAVPFNGLVPSLKGLVTFTAPEETRTTRTIRTPRTIRTSQTTRTLRTAGLDSVLERFTKSSRSFTVPTHKVLLSRWFGPDPERHGGCSSAARRFALLAGVHLTSQLAPTKVLDSASGKTVDAQRCTHETARLRCSVGAGLRCRRLRFDGCHSDGAFTRKVRGRARCSHVSCRLRW